MANELEMLPVVGSALFLFVTLECVEHHACIPWCVPHKWLHGLQPYWRQLSCLST